jgi:hypothetical protein
MTSGGRLNLTDYGQLTGLRQASTDGVRVEPPAESRAPRKQLLSSLLAIHEKQRKAANQSNGTYDRGQRQGVGSLGGHVQRPQVYDVVSTGIADALVGEGDDSDGNKRDCQ